MRTPYVLAFVALLLAGLGTGIGGALLFAPNTGPYEGSRDFILPEDASLKQAVDTLQAKQILVSPTTFRVVARVTGWGSQFKAGHYDVELNLEELAELSTDTRMVRDSNREYTLENGEKVFVLGDGRLINLAAAEGHPSEVMDMSFANQFRAHLDLVQRHESSEMLENKVYDIPQDMDDEIAEVKLRTMDIQIDSLSDEQEHYATDYSAGT